MLLWSRATNASAASSLRACRLAVLCQTRTFSALSGLRVANMRGPTLVSPTANTSLAVLAPKSPISVDGRRSFFTRFAVNRQLQALEREADQNATDADRQAAFLRKLNTVDPEAVIRRVDSRRFGTNEAVLKEYIKALVMLGRLDRTRLTDVARMSEGSGLQELTFSNYASGGGQGYQDTSGDPRWANGGGGGGGRGGLGDVLKGRSEPLLVAMAEPPFKVQLWRAIRAVAMAYLVLLGVTTIMEERGLTRSTPNAHDVAQASQSTKTFKDVVGVDEAREELAEIVDFLKNPTKFTRLGGKMTKGVLLMGPPGTGKTLLAKAIAGEAGVPFFYASGSEFEEMYVGVGARRVRDLFESAKKRSPCIIFIDEIDAIGATRNPKDQQYMRMTLNQLLSEMDGFKSTEGIVVIAATNFPEVLDKALMRPGRFDRHVVVPNPDVRGRTQILGLHLKSVPKAPDVDPAIIARGTPGFSGADLANLVNIAAIKASHDNKSAISMAELEYAKDRVMMGAERKSAALTEASRRLTAYHESGHAIVASFTEGALPVHKATIVPRGMALGLVMQLPDADETSFSRQQMEAKMDVCMAGRVAEELIFGAQHVTSGASSDFEQATNIARNMVERWGMSDKIGYVAHKHGRRDGEVVSEETRAAIDAEVKRLTDRAYANARKLLQREEARLHALTRELLDKETLTGDEVRKILGIPPPPASGRPSPYDSKDAKPGKAAPAAPAAAAGGKAAAAAVS